MNLKQMLESMTGKAYEWPKAFDVIGDIAIVAVPDELMGYSRDIGLAIMKLNSHVSTVYAKLSGREGLYRIHRLKLIAGQRKELTIHVENGCRFLVNVRRDYFSPREGTERMRVLKFVRPSDRVMVFFAGVGPFPICISKHTGAESTGIELNPSAVRHFRKNIMLNRLKNVKPVLGDVKKLYRKFSGYDHVFMPYPARAAEFLKEAMHVGSLIHFYFFAKNWKEGLAMIEEHTKPKVVDVRKVLPYAPGVWKWRITFSFS